MSPNVTPSGGIAGGVPRQGVPPVPPLIAGMPSPSDDPFWASIQAQDLQALDMLAVLHRVAAGVLFAIGLIGVPGFLMFRHLAVTNAASDVSPIAGQYFGIFDGFALLVIGLHMAGAALLWTAGGWLRSRRHYGVVWATQAIMLLVVPHGTALGIFGLITLLKPHVRAEFTP